MGAPSNFEQEALELINRARADPYGEIARLITSTSPLTGANRDITAALNGFRVSVETLKAQLTGVAAVAPLAWNSNLSDAATYHSTLLIQADEQSHQVAGEASLGDRVRLFGYTGFTGVGENVFSYSTSALQSHAGFYIDWGSTSTGIQDPPGHRINILRSSYTEVGISAIAENNPATQVGPFVVTQDFGSRSTYKAQIVGVVFRDADSDNFYDAGEGIGGQTVTLLGAGGTYITNTWASGGYQIEAPTGSYTITFSGAGVTTRTSSVTLGSANVKIDNNDALTKAALLAAGQTLTGDSNANQLTGGPANDVITGGGGNDVIDGGAGSDVAIFTGTRGQYFISVSGGKAVVRDTAAARDGVDLLANVEKLQFSDKTVVSPDSVSEIGIAIADQLSVVYLGRGVSFDWRNATADVVANGVSANVLKSFYSVAVADRAFTATDSVQTIVNKTFQNIFGVDASTFEQNAWAATVSAGAVTLEALPWAMFNSYLGATNVPSSYQIPAQSRIIAVNAFTNQVNGSVDASLGGVGPATAEAARAWLKTIRSQADAATKVAGVEASVAAISSGRATASFSPSAEIGPSDADLLPLTGVELTSIL